MKDIKRDSFLQERKLTTMLKEAEGKASSYESTRQTVEAKSSQLATTTQDSKIAEMTAKTKHRAVQQESLFRKNIIAQSIGSNSEPGQC